jgi:hypothetical protein
VDEPEAKLYIDGKVADTVKGGPSNPHVAILRGSIDIDGTLHIVEIFGRKEKLKICVDRVKLAGDLA